MECKKCGANMSWDPVEQVYLCLNDGTRGAGSGAAQPTAPPAALSTPPAPSVPAPSAPPSGAPEPAQTRKPKGRKAEPRQLEGLEPGVTRQQFFADLRKVSKPVTLDLRAAIAERLDQGKKVELDDLSDLLVRCLREDPGSTLKALGFLGKTFSANDVWDAAGVILVDEILKRTAGVEQVGPGQWRSV